MLWDLIRDFFVQHVFGGLDSVGGGYAGFIGYNGYADQNIDTYNMYYNVGGADYNGSFDEPVYISVGDWLSTTATIISISIIVVLCCLFVYKIIKLIGGLIR